ncbi:uncharacterized protein LOC115755938 [Rhodamnia argentea]|uniref:Uncharacterized protein LOC115755938 n=1 Tax=Rhodamnia argentea TaxID=178133 RepID=A0A8B8QW19_9MYRT|nr:uncharacterized protein LOC115755938 [Rhodamnia argentea]
MSFVSTSTPPTLASLHNLSFSLRHRCPKQPSLCSLAASNPRPDASTLLLCRASKSQSNPVKKRQPSSADKRKKKSKGVRDVEVVDDFVIGEDEGERSGSGANAAGYHPTPLPNPPAGFIVDDQGRVVMASDKRLVTIVDPTNNFPLECAIRRIFRSSSGDECMLLCPADTPVQILKSTNIDGWSAVSDEEVESILPTAAYALAKIHMHLVYSGFCYTARGGFCYSEDDIFDFRTDDGQDVDGLPTEGVEITCFHMDGAHYMIYTPSDPLLFVAVKDHNGQLQIADDDLLEDPCIISAIDEETEFNALVEEEAALLESLMGER